MSRQPVGPVPPTGWRGTWGRWSGPRSRQVVIIVLSAINVGAQAYVVGRLFGLAQAALVGLLGGLATASLGWRHRYPLAVTAITAVTYLASQVLLPVGFALLTLAIVRRDRTLLAATAGVALCLMAPSPWHSTAVFDVPTLIGGFLGALFWALWGAYVGARRELVASLRDRAARAEQERELKAEQARLAERARIAREMHDVLAHKVSLIALQAGGLEVNPGVGADRVQQTAGLIRTTARDALEELREVLGVLRTDSPPAGDHLAPQPGLADVPSLVESSRSAGVQIRVAIEPMQVPDAVGRTVYRVVQEALTNVHKHARGAATAISITSAPQAVLISVTNRCPVGADSLLPGAGSGLIGLRERVGLIGGSLTAGPTADGGWRLDARLPIAPRPATELEARQPDPVPEALRTPDAGRPDPAQPAGDPVRHQG